MEPAAAAGSPASASCSRHAALCARPAGGDRASGATYELSAGSFHWAHKSFPVDTKHSTENVSRCAFSIHLLTTDTFTALQAPLQRPAASSYHHPVFGTKRSHSHYLEPKWKQMGRKSRSIYLHFSGMSPQRVPFIASKRLPA